MPVSRSLCYDVCMKDSIHFADMLRERALDLMRQVVAEPYWARLGHVAAETDLIRLGAVK